MKAEDKSKYVDEARQLAASIDIDHFISNPNDSNEVGKINRLIAIFNNFSSGDGQELKKLFALFQKWARSSTRVGTIKNRVADMIQFIGQKIEEMDIYKIEPQAETDEKLDINNILIPKQPESIGKFYWVVKLFKRIILKKNGKISVFKLFLIVIFLIVALLVCSKIYYSINYRGAFRYEMLSKSYLARGTAIPTVIDGWFEGKVKNISNERRFLDRFHYVLWREEGLGRVWDYGYGLGKVYEITGSEKKEISMPILFEPNESKQLAWDLEINVSDQGIYNAYAERTGKGVFTWAKRDIDLQFEDTRGNIFDEEGKLISQSVIDAWWVLPNNKTFFRKLSAYSDLFFKVFAWKVRRFLHMTS